MAMSGNFGADMAPTAKRTPRVARAPRMSRAAPALPIARAMPGGPLPQPAPVQQAFPPAPAMPPPALGKKIAPLKSTKPSDTPMAMAKMMMGKPTGPIKPMAIMPKVVAKPTSKPVGKRVTRPKTGMK